MYEEWIEELKELISLEFGEITKENATTVAYSLGTSVRGLKDLMGGEVKKTFINTYEMFYLFGYEFVVEKDKFVYVGDPLEVSYYIIHDYEEDMCPRLRNDFKTNVFIHNRSFSFKMIERFEEIGFSFRFQKCME